MLGRHHTSRMHRAVATALFAAVLLGGALAPVDRAEAGPGFALSVTKTASPTTYTAAGQTVSYTYVVTDFSSDPNDFAASITVTDDKVSPITCPSTSLIAGGSMTCTGSYTTTGADVTAGSVTNTVTVNGLISLDVIPDTATANATINFLPQPSWTLNKTASPTTYTAAGQTINYTYTLQNTGNVSISGISVADDKIASVTCAATTLAVGASTTCSGSYVTAGEDVVKGSITNNATATGTPSGGILSNAIASATVNLNPQPAWTLSKTASPTTYTASGQTISYSYTLANTGNVSISSISVSDDKIASVTCAATSLAVNASTTCSGSYTTTSADVAAGSVTNNATATGTPSSGTLSDAKASAMISLNAQPSWTLTKTANPATFTDSGQTITYTYTLNNTGNVSISSISVSDNKIASVSCAATSLAIGASTTCSGTYKTTTADVTAGLVTNTATAHGTPASGNLSDAKANATVRYRVVTGSITIVKTALGGNGKFSFTSSLAGSKQFTLTTVGGSALKSFAGLTAGTYTFTEVDLPLHWKLSSLVCTGDKGGRVTTTDLSGRTATIGLDAGEAIVCTFTNAFDVIKHRKQTQDFIHNFIGRRLRMLADSGPDRARFVRRLPGALWGRGHTHTANAAPAATPFNMAGDTQPMSSRFSFSTSMSQIIQASMTVPDEGNGRTSAVPGAPQREPAAHNQNTGLDIWAEAHYRNFRDADSLSNFALLYVGADYLVTPSVLVGALVQRDWDVERSRKANTVAHGAGVMGGPYVSARLTPNLFFDARAAWGTSDNSINPFGLYTDKFSTDRWLVSSRLTGNLVFGHYRITPSMTVDYIEENQHSYTDSLGVSIPGQTVALGRFAFGPEIARQYLYDDGSIVEPQLELTGVWDFENPDVSPLSSLYVGHADLHAAIRAGLQVHRPDGVSIRITSSYDGIATGSFGSFGAQVWLNVPLN